MGRNLSATSAAQLFANRRVHGASAIKLASGATHPWYRRQCYSIVSHHVLPLVQITVGEEGFFLIGTKYTTYNPTGTPSNVTPGWGGRVGQVHTFRSTSRPQL